MEGIAHALRGKRVAMVHTQNELASRANVSKLTIHNLEAGKSVHLDTLIDVARVLGLAHRLVKAFSSTEDTFTGLEDLERVRETRKRGRVPA